MPPHRLVQLPCRWKNILRYLTESQWDSTLEKLLKGRTVEQNRVEYKECWNPNDIIGYLEDFLRDSKSSLVDEINESFLEALLVSLEVANETDTELSLRNIGVLMFTERPDKFIPGAQIDLVKFNTEEAEGSDDFLL